MDHIIRLDDAQVREVVKPFVSYMLAGTQLMFADSDFVYTKDEFMRDTPGKYELNIGWIQGLGVYADRYIISSLTLTHPQRLDSTKLYVGKVFSYQLHPNMGKVLELFDVQRAAGQAEDEENFLRLTW